VWSIINDSRGQYNITFVKFVCSLPALITSRMRIFAISDIHIDYPENMRWVENISHVDHQSDILIVAGDISDNLHSLSRCFTELTNKFKHVCYTPGNHELWVIRDSNDKLDSLAKLDLVLQRAGDCGVHTSPLETSNATIIPLFSWYDFSFGEPQEKLLRVWNDFRACRWPDDLTIPNVAEYFFSLNRDTIAYFSSLDSTKDIITFSHFLPRIDLIPHFAWPSQGYLFPVFGSTHLIKQVQSIRPKVHIYGHSHLNVDKTLDGIRYINNAFAYPSESHIARKKLFEIRLDQNN